MSITPQELLGEWQQQSAFITINGERKSTFNPNTKKIKLFTLTHFALFNREYERSPFSKGVPDEERLAAAKAFDAACGRYRLAGETYIEQVEFASFPNYEGMVFEFNLNFDGITLTQTGRYPLVELGFGAHDGYLEETYIRQV